MRIQQENAYPVAADALFAVFTDRAYYEAYYARAGQQYEFRHFGPRGDRFVIDVRRHVAMRAGANIPAVAKRFVRDVNVLHTVTEWRRDEQGTHHARYSFSIEGVPVEIAGETSILPRGDISCLHRIDVKVSCNIPLVGGKIAQMVGERAGSSISKDYEATLAYLREAGKA